MTRGRPVRRVGGLRSALVAGLVLPVLVVACSGGSGASGGSAGDGGSGGSGPTAQDTPETVSRADAAAGVADLFARLSPDSAGAAPCVGEALVADLPPAELQSAGLLSPDGTAPEQVPALDGATAAAWVDAWFGCVDYVEVTTRAQRRASRTLDAPAFRACLRDALTDEELRTAATDGLSGDVDSPAVRRLSEAQATCAQQHS